MLTGLLFCIVKFSVCSLGVDMVTLIVGFQFSGFGPGPRWCLDYIPIGLSFFRTAERLMQLFQLLELGEGPCLRAKCLPRGVCFMYNSEITVYFPYQLMSATLCKGDIDYQLY